MTIWSGTHNNTDGDFSMTMDDSASGYPVYGAGIGYGVYSGPYGFSLTLMHDEAHFMYRWYGTIHSQGMPSPTGLKTDDTNDYDADVLLRYGNNNKRELHVTSGATELPDTNWAGLGVGDPEIDVTHLDENGILWRIRKPTLPGASDITNINLSSLPGGGIRVETVWLIEGVTPATYQYDVTVANPNITGDYVLGPPAFNKATRGSGPTNEHDDDVLARYSHNNEVEYLGEVPDES